MLENLHKTVFPFLSNFSLIVYDLGLAQNERKQYQKYCKCQLLTFPFEKLPDHFRQLKVFAWKVFIIAAHFEQAEVTMWTDASIVTTNTSALLATIEKTRSSGVQQRCNKKIEHFAAPPNPAFTLPHLFEAFGDSPCAHTAFHQCEGGFGLYHREPLVRHAVIEPWLACAFSTNCIMPAGGACFPTFSRFSEYSGMIGVCHRNDQSAISLILAKLFREKFHHFAIETDTFQRVDKYQRANYFPSVK